ncbi:hypothetical protein DFH06DRAFT_1139697 [Mycena polygramma]|nr:hypothetical protein DFH06DRAFT_1139697 [Mycena polygramma]
MPQLGLGGLRRPQCLAVPPLVCFLHLAPQYLSSGIHEPHPLILWSTSARFEIVTYDAPEGFLSLSAARIRAHPVGGLDNPILQLLFLLFSGLRLGRRSADTRAGDTSWNGAGTWTCLAHLRFPAVLVGTSSSYISGGFVCLQALSLSSGYQLALLNLLPLCN